MPPSGGSRLSRFTVSANLERQVVVQFPMMEGRRVVSDFDGS